MPPVNVPRVRALEAIRPKPARAPGIVTIQYARRKAFDPEGPGLAPTGRDSDGAVD